jgi:BASS family bile acid:Na+ symporter
MRGYLDVASQALVLVFVLSTLFTVGLLVSARQVLAVLRQRRSLAVALCANFVVLPVAALAVCQGLQLSSPVQAALLLVATAPGSPVFARLSEVARADQAKAVGLLLLLMSLTVVFQPLLLPLLLPGLSVSPMPIARTLVLTVLLPLMLGLLLKARLPALAVRLRPAISRLGNISAALAFILLPLAYLDELKSVATSGGGLLVLSLYLPLAVGAGWWLGGPRADERRLLAMCCGQGSMGAAFVIAAHNFNDPHIVAMLVLILLCSLALLIPMALAFRLNRPRKA